MGRLESFTVHIEALQREKGVTVYLPKAYDTSDACFPVIYTHDGQNMFLDALAYNHVSWGVQDEMERLEAAGCTDGFIVVALDHGEHLRADEYSPWPFEKKFQRFAKGRIHGGDGAAYGEFYVNTLIPLINSKYRTKQGVENTTIVGSSLGAFISLYMYCAYPAVFGTVGLFSTALWFSQTEMLDFLQDKTAGLDTRFFISVGTNEKMRDLKFDFPKIFLENSKLVKQELLRMGAPENHLRYVIAEDESHSEGAWKKMFPRFMEYLLDSGQ